MARRLYGGSTADFTFDGDKTVANVRLAVATAPTSLSRVTTGLESTAGAAITAVLSDTEGEVRFWGTDLPTTLYVAAITSSNTIPGPWYVINSQDVGALIDQLTATQISTAAVIADLQNQVAALQGDTVTAPIANPTGLAATFDETTRRPTVTWTLPTTGKIRLALTGSTGVTATSADVEAGAQSYTFTAALPAGSGYFQVVATSLDATGQPTGISDTVRVSPRVGVTLTTPTTSGRVVSTTVRVTGGDGSPIAVGVRAQVLNGAGTVLSSADLPNVQATTAGVVASWTVPDSTAATIVRFTASASGVTAVNTASVTVASNLSSVTPVSGVDGYFDAATRLATVTWAQPRTGSVTVTRTDNLGATGSTTIDASTGTYTFAAAVAPTATSLQMTVTGADASTGSKTLDVTASATIPTTAVTAPSTSFVTTGTWAAGSASEVYTSGAGATATLDFTGTYLQLIVVTDSHHGTMTVKVDTAAAVTVNEKTTARNTTAIVYTVTGLASGAHKVLITAVGDGVITVVGAKVTSYSGAPTTTPPTTGGGGGTTTPVSGFVTRDPNAARLLLGGKPWKFCGFNGVNFFGATNSTRQITDYEDYYANKAPNEVTRVWFQPGMGSNFTQMDAAIAAAKRHNAKIYITLFDALGSYGPKWADMKSQWGTYSQHVARVVGRYKDETAVAFWEIANEPPQDKEGFDLVGGAIKAIDSNHLVATGTNATYSDSAVANFQNAGSSIFVDILSMHEYDSLTPGPSGHTARILPAARALKKPIIIGEFGIDASADGSGVGNTGHNGATTFAGRATLLRQKIDGYLNLAEVCGVSYWSIGKNDIGTSSDSYMAYSDTLGINAMKTMTSKWSMNGTSNP